MVNGITLFPPVSNVLIVFAQSLKTYENDRNRIIGDFNEEEETQLDYGGRAIWELLQNADDAMAPLDTQSAQLIGVKGLGFKSVLEITDEPEIYSLKLYRLGSLMVYFSFIFKGLRDD